ncbi:MAG TPA: MFS transporter [Fimbriimonadaceae bacterium]|jgi:MFS family permease
MSKREEDGRGRVAFSELALLFAVFLDLCGFGMAFPDLQLRAEWFAKNAGIAKPGILIGLLLASYFVVQFLVSPHWGRLSDGIGRKPVLLICTALSASSMLMYALSTNIWGILASRVLAGLAAANVVVAQAYVADTSEEGERTAKQGRVSAALLLGLVAGPAIGGLLAHAGGNRLLGFVAAGASTLSLIWIAVAIPSHLKPTTPREPGKHPIFNFSLLKESKPLRVLFFYAASGWFVLACLEGTFGRLIEHNLGFGQEQFGWIFAYESLLGAVVGFLLTWVAMRVKEQTILRGGYLLEGLGLITMPFAPGLLALFGASTAYAIGLGFVNPTINGVGSELAPADRQGEMFGVLQGTRSVGFMVGPVLGGALFDLRPGLPYFLAGGIALLLAVALRINNLRTSP